MGDPELAPRLPDLARQPASLLRHRVRGEVVTTRTLPNGIICLEESKHPEERQLFLAGIGYAAGSPSQINRIVEGAGALKPDPENDSSFRETLGLIRRYEEAKDRRNKRLSNWWAAVRVVFLEGADKSLADEAASYYDESQGEIRQILLQLSRREWTPEPEDTRHEMGQ